MRVETRLPLAPRTAPSAGFQLPCPVAATAAAMELARSSPRRQTWVRPLTAAARAGMSEFSSGSAAVCQVAMSPAGRGSRQGRQPHRRRVPPTSARANTSTAVLAAQARDAPPAPRTDEVHHRRARPPRIVQVGQPVGQPRAEVQQRECWAACHAGETVCSACAHRLVQAEYGAQGLAGTAPNGVDSGHKVHLRRA